jgi:pilus assembly protein Flp/PilA
VAGWRRSSDRSFEKEKAMNEFKRFIQSEDGPTATEYAVMLALIIIVALTAITTLGQKVTAIFTATSSKLPTG